MAEAELGDFEKELLRELRIPPSLERARRLEEKFFYDPRWKLLNNVGLRQLLPWIHERARREGKYFRLYYIDLHNLHKTNRQHGDAGGDALLAAMANVLRSFYPAATGRDRPTISEIQKHQVAVSGGSVTVAVGRWGGDEFLALVLADDAVALESFGEDLQKRFQGQKARMPDHSDVTLSTSFGKSDLSEEKTWQEMLEEANAESNREKAEGGLGRDHEGDVPSP